MKEQSNWLCGDVLKDFSNAGYQWASYKPLHKLLLLALFAETAVLHRSGLTWSHRQATGTQVAPWQGRYFDVRIGRTKTGEAKWSVNDGSMSVIRWEGRPTGCAAHIVLGPKS